MRKRATASSSPTREPFHRASGRDDGASKVGVRFWLAGWQPEVTGYFCGPGLVYLRLFAVVFTGKPIEVPLRRRRCSASQRSRAFSSLLICAQRRYRQCHQKAFQNSLFSRSAIRPLKDRTGARLWASIIILLDTSSRAAVPARGPAPRACVLGVLRSLGDPSLDRVDQPGDGREDRPVVAGELAVQFLQSPLDGFLGHLSRPKRARSARAAACAASAIRSGQRADSS
jgi:hypothetical protein